MQLPSPAVTVILLVLCAWPLHGSSGAAGNANVMAVEFAADPGAAARQAAGISGGRVLDVQTRFDGERAIYLVKVLLNDGRVKIIQIEGGPPPMPGVLGR